MTALPRWKAIRGDEIGGDHVWWFHRTFRERAPGGFGRSVQAGYRTRRRETGSDGTGKQNSHSIHDDTDLRLMALVLLGLAEVPDVRGRLNLNGAAQGAVMRLNGWEAWQGSFRSLLDRAADPANREKKRDYADSLTSKEAAMVAAYYRVYDFLRCVDRSDRVARQAAKDDLIGHIAWLRSSPDHPAFLRSERTRLLVAAGQPVRP